MSIPTGLKHGKLKLLGFDLKLPRLRPSNSSTIFTQMVTKLEGGNVFANRLRLSLSFSLSLSLSLSHTHFFACRINTFEQRVVMPSSFPLITRCAYAAALLSAPPQITLAHTQTHVQ